MPETILISVLIVAICILLLTLQILLKKKGKFPNTHVGGNPFLKRRGIGCVQTQDREARTTVKWPVKASRPTGKKK